MGKTEKDCLQLSDINAEIEKRIKEMESSDYVFPIRLKKGDWLGFLCLIILSAATIIGLIIFCAVT